MPVAPWADTRLSQVEAAICESDCDCAGCVDALSLVREVRRLNDQIREFRSLLECTEFAIEWLIMYHVIENDGADWKSKLDGSPFFACDCSESGGFMEWDTNAYIHTERCSSGFADSLPALYDQIKAALERRVVVHTAGRLASEEGGGK